MLQVLTAADVRRQDEACAARGIATATLMEAAGAGVARASRDLLGGTYGRRIVAVCGKGNNGGDGLVAARHLAAWGAHVSVVLVGAAESPAARENLAVFGGRVLTLDRLSRELGRAHLVIDAVLGVGLSRAPEGAAAAAIGSLASSEAPVVAVDVPSGVDADTGGVPGVAARAVVTVTLGGPKPGLYFEPGRSLAGRVVVHDIGVPEDLRGGSARVLERSDVAGLVPRRAPGAHKRLAGTVLVVAGSRAMPGAASLVVAAAVRGGAGLVALAAPEGVCAAVVGRTPEATTVPIPESPEGTLDEKGLDLIRPALASADTLVVGPGLSTHPAAAEAVRALVAEARVPTVIDADALTAVAQATDVLGGGRAFVTPHAGELARLTGRDAADLESDRLGSARAAADGLGAVVVFKGPGTVVAAPGGPVFVNPTGGPALSQGGTGDVLAGLLGAVIAQRVRAGSAADAESAALAAWVHGAAGDRVAGTWGLARASVLADALSEVLAELRA